MEPPSDPEIRPPLTEEDCPEFPFPLFARWFDEAVAAGLPEPTAMTLATASAEGRPSARTVLLKAFDEAGFVFYTNYTSRKARELEANPVAALLFHWATLQRQVRIEGAVARVSRAESAAYFCTRPRGSQIGAWASRQSQEISQRSELERRVAEVEARFAGREVDLPDFWGGYRVTPIAIEFWQGGGYRLHDRILYTKRGADWELARLAP